MFTEDWFRNFREVLGSSYDANRGAWNYAWKRVKRNINLIAWTLLLVSVSRVSTARIVLGEERVCSTKTIVGQKNIQHLNSLVECDIIEGSLTVAYLDFRKHRPEALPLREITGSLVVYRITHLRSLEELFPNLILIRGLELFGTYSLVIHENLELQQIGLVSLIKILHGSVRITKNPLLCYVHTIDWIRILEDLTQQHYVLKYNRNQNHCPLCMVGKTDLSKVKHCWSYNKPQRICPNACGSGECDAAGKCCEANCLFNCPNATHSNCEVCKFFKANPDSNPSVPCVKNCAMRELIIGDRRCISSSKCKEHGFLTFKDACVKRCPEGSIQLGERCEECKDNCIKLTCKGGIIKTAREARRFTNCAHIEGFLELQLVERGTNLIAELEKSLSNIENITEFLRVWKSPQLTSLSFFRKLKLIEGKKLIWDKYSVVVSDNFHLAHVWGENKTVIVLNGLIYFHFNPHLCFGKIDKYVKSARDSHSSPRVIYIDNVSTYTNGRMAVCGPNVTELDVTIEKYNATALLTHIKIDPRMFEDKRTFFGYMYYFTEAPEGTLSIPDGRHGCGYDSWKLNLDLSKNARHILKNLKPFTRYAFFVKTFAVASSLYPKEGHSKIMYFTTLAWKPGPVSKFYMDPDFDSVNLHWWPPSQPNGKISSYLIEAVAEVLPVARQERMPANLTQGTANNEPEYENVATEVHNRKLVDTRLNITLACACASDSKWRGYPLKHNQFYDETETMFEDEVYNHVYVSANETRKVDRNDSMINSKDNDTKLDQILKKLEKDTYDTGPNSFPIIMPKERQQNVSLPNTTHSVSGDQHHYRLNNLLPGTRYRVTITACTGSDLCGPKTALNLTTPAYNF